MQVLQFECFYLESVSESPDEAFRVRNHVLRYYLSDSTLELIEPPVLNSGIMPGKVLKRHAVAKGDGSGPVGPADFTIGGTVTIYGRTLKFVACNALTRVSCAAAGSFPYCCLHWQARSHTTVSLRLSSRGVHAGVV
jgi:hypothetical protein